MIRIDEKNVAAIAAHAESEYPHECGGMLIGRFEEAGRKTVTEIFPLENAREEEARYNRVLILPHDVLRADKYARERQLDVIGYYHSHPESPAVPSQYDLDHALPVWSYVIASVMTGKVIDIFSWEMENDRSKFNEEQIEKSFVHSE
jgi:proteasome lid subunit RPN8/RPN11